MVQLLDLAERLKTQARDGVMAYWLENGIDRECGGYWTDLARDRGRYGHGEKWIIVQMRTVYSFCLAYQFFGEQMYLDLAEHGVRFFREHMRDTTNGGWFYCVSRDGDQVLDASKQPYGLAFVSYGLAEYARLTGDEQALDDAIATHELVMAHCWDRVQGGLPNRFSPHWQLVEGIKRVDTHMHTMEGVSAIYRATGDRRWLHRLGLLADTILAPIGRGGCYDAENGCTHEHFFMDWVEYKDTPGGATNLGHVTEAGWFIAKLAAYSGDQRQYALAKALVDWAIEHGFDQERGGLYDYADPYGQVVRDDKVWWNQAEMLGALAFLYRLTGEPRYYELLEKHIDFVEHHVLDSEYGEWYPHVAADGSVTNGPDGLMDRKGSRWKSPYHVIQGLYHAYHDLRRAAGAEKVATPKAWADYCL